jgi:hypothetical protein
VGAVLDEQRADRRQLGDLVAPEAPSETALILTELMPASTARLRIVRDDLIDLILASQPAAPPGWPPCAPALRSTPCLASSSLALARASARRC